MAYLAARSNRLLRRPQGLLATLFPTIFPLQARCVGGGKVDTLRRLLNLTVVIVVGGRVQSLRAFFPHGSASDSLNTLLCIWRLPNAHCLWISRPCLLVSFDLLPAAVWCHREVAVRHLDSAVRSDSLAFGIRQAGLPEQDALLYQVLAAYELLPLRV